MSNLKVRNKPISNQIFAPIYHSRVSQISTGSNILGTRLKLNQRHVQSLTDINKLPLLPTDSVGMAQEGREKKMSQKMKKLSKKGLMNLQKEPERDGADKRLALS